MPLQKTTPQEIIGKSIAVFRQKGYYRTSMAELAKASGLTKGAFYHHFTNKEEVMKEALRMASSWFAKHVFGIAYKEGSTPQAKMQEMAHAAYQAFSTDAGGCFFANTVLETAHVEDTFLEEIDGFFSNWEQALRKLLQSAYSAQEAEKLAQVTIADIEGSIILMQLRKDTRYLKAAIERAIHLL